ncbi:helix-turn-helix domain-containing protein [Streptomyces harbinensis]|uniref:helix-turn-helix domain-containing protein n=1 Tax=Streptomyces harbinensis TaxID=1176198 RepID=UPI0036A9F47E
MTEVTIRPCGTDTELHRHYSREHKAQPTYIELDLEDGVMLADYDSEVGGGSPEAVHHGRVRRYRIPVLTAAAANSLMEELKPLAQRVLDGATIEWDGSNKVGRLNDDAAQAEAEISDRLDIEGEDWDESETVAEWDIDGATNGNEREEYGITATTSDERLEEIAATILDDLAEVSESGVAVCPELLPYLKQLREEAADEDPATPAEVTLTREQLGLTGDQLAKLLDVNPRTVRSWESGRNDVTGWVTIRLAELRQAADAAVAEIVAKHNDEEGVELVTYRTKGPEGLKLPWTVTYYGPGWHRAITARAAAQLSGARVVFAGDDE